MINLEKNSRLAIFMMYVTYIVPFLFKVIKAGEGGGGGAAGAAKQSGINLVPGSSRFPRLVGC